MSQPERLSAFTFGSKLREGDRVEVYPLGTFWGEGTIVDKSTSSYGGSKLYPVFHVVTDDGTDDWFSAISLKWVGGNG